MKRRLMHAVVGAATIGLGVLGSLTVPGPGAAMAAPAVGCAGASVSTFLPSPGLTGWSENATFDDAGNLWVSRTLAGVVERYDRQGSRTASIAVDSPGSVRPGPGGRMYVTSGNTTINMLPVGPRSGTVRSFDPAAPHRGTRVYARGLGMPDGLAFDDGTAYVADSRLGVLKLTPKGGDAVIDEKWSAKAPTSLSPFDVANGLGINGAAISRDGGTLYTTLTASLGGRVIAVPLDDPSSSRAVTDLTAPLPGVLDDLVVLDSPGGSDVLAVTTLTGQVHIVDTATRGSCVVNAGAPLTALAVDPADARRLVATSELGDVLEIRLN